ncbi:MAG: M23 family metallopeptidase [Pyrinomonadaceae bacterium]
MHFKLRAFIAGLLVLIVAAVAWLVLSHRMTSIVTTGPPTPTPAVSSLNPSTYPRLIEATPTPGPESTPTEESKTEPTQTSSATFPQSFVGTLNLVIPVAGVKPQQLIDTFSEARSEGRVHDAIDIPAAQGTPVLAAANGRIVKLFQSDRGGTTIYESSTDGKIIFYYAHLQRFADNGMEGSEVRQGQVIAYVGDTGNAGPGNFHLHFSISVVADPKRYWEGTNINPYPLLHR